MNNKSLMIKMLVCRYKSKCIFAKWNKRKKLKGIES